MTQQPTVDVEKKSMTNEKMLDYINGCKIKHSDRDVFVADSAVDERMSNKSHTSSVGQYMSEQNCKRDNDLAATDDCCMVSQFPHISTSYNDSMQYVDGNDIIN